MADVAVRHLPTTAPVNAHDATATDTAFPSMASAAKLGDQSCGGVSVRMRGHTCPPMAKPRCVCWVEKNIYIDMKRDMQMHILENAACAKTVFKNKGVDDSDGCQEDPPEWRRGY